MNELMDRLVQVANAPDPKPFLFEVGQQVRVCKGVIDDGQTPAFWSGRYGIIESRYCTMFGKRHYYKVANGGRRCDFEEHELDMRFSRRKEAP